MTTKYKKLAWLITAGVLLGIAVFLIIDSMPYVIINYDSSLPRVVKTMAFNPGVVSEEVFYARVSSFNAKPESVKLELVNELLEDASASNNPAYISLSLSVIANLELSFFPADIDVMKYLHSENAQVVYMCLWLCSEHNLKPEQTILTKLTQSENYDVARFARALLETHY